MCMGIVFKYTVSGQQTQASVKYRFMPGPCEALHAFPINFRNALFTHRGPTFPPFCVKVFILCERGKYERKNYVFICVLFP